MTSSSCVLVLAARNVHTEQDAVLFLQLVQDQLQTMPIEDLPAVLRELQSQLTQRSAVITSLWTAMMTIQRLVSTKSVADHVANL